MENLTRAEIELMIRDESEKIMSQVVMRPFCVERHKEVTTLGDKIKSIDNRLWMLLIMGLGQLVAVIIALMK